MFIDRLANWLTISRMRFSPRLLTGLLLTVLAVYAITGVFVRPYADDVMFIQLAKQTNPIVAQYYTWHGRYGYSFFMGMIMPIAPTLVVQIFPAVIISLMVLTFYRIAKRYVANPLLASSGITLAFLVGLPNIWQSFYWFGSSANYMIPIIMFAAVLLWLWR